MPERVPELLRRKHVQRLLQQLRDQLRAAGVRVPLEPLRHVAGQPAAEPVPDDLPGRLLRRPRLDDLPRLPADVPDLQRLRELPEVLPARDLPGPSGPDRLRVHCRLRPLPELDLPPQPR